MKWPALVPPAVCNVRLTLRLQEGLNLDGSPRYMEPVELACNYTEQARTTVDAQRRLVTLAAVALLPGDPAPGRDIAGEAVVHDAGDPAVTRKILRASRARNPDGTVNYTKLELM